MTLCWVSEGKREKGRMEEGKKREETGGGGEERRKERVGSAEEGRNG